MKITLSVHLYSIYLSLVPRLALTFVTHLLFNFKGVRELKVLEKKSMQKIQDQKKLFAAHGYPLLVAHLLAGVLISSLDGRGKLYRFFQSPLRLQENALRKMMEWSVKKA